MKKILALVLALVMALGVTSAFADGLLKIGYVQVGHDEPERRLHWGWIVLIVVAVLLVLFIAASYLFTEQMSPILDQLLYSKEELELLQWRKP